MAEPVNSSSSTHSTNPKFFSRDVSKITNKRKNLSTSAIFKDHPSKRPHTASSSKKEDIEDTATSEPRNKEEEAVDNGLEIDLLKGVLDFKTRTGVNPFEDSIAMNNFLDHCVHLGIGRIGNMEGLKVKIEEVKNKFKKQSDVGIQIVDEDLGK